MRLILTLFFALIPMFAAAQPAGHDSPRLQSAIQAWLADDDQTALPALAKLAAKGNTAAQILLGRIPNRPMGAWLAGMNRKDRNKLMRAPGGLSGKSWLKVAADSGDELASLFKQVSSPRSEETEIHALLTVKEQLAAINLALIILNRKGAVPLKAQFAAGDMGQDAVYIALTNIPGGHLFNSVQARNLDKLIAQTAPLMDPGAEYIRILHRDLLDNPGNIQQERYVRLFHFGELKARSGKFDLNELEALGAQFALAPPTNRPLSALRKICSAKCPTEIGACFALGLNLAGGYEELRRLSSPTETLISQATYAGSPRAVTDLQRWVRDRAKTSRSGWRGPYRQALSCFDTAFPGVP